jgi:hypothetical protein
MSMEHDKGGIGKGLKIIALLFILVIFSIQSKFYEAREIV